MLYPDYWILNYLLLKFQLVCITFLIKISRVPNKWFNQCAKKKKNQSAVKAQAFYVHGRTDLKT